MTQSSALPPLTLSDRHLRLVLHCAAEELQARRRGKPPGPRPWNFEVIRALENQLSLTQSRQVDCEDAQDLRHENPIGAGEVARILGWPRRRVQRRAPELDGRLVAGRFLFDSNNIRQLAERMAE
jgi:hypothetical protein